MYFLLTWGIMMSHKHLIKETFFCLTNIAKLKCTPRFMPTQNTAQEDKSCKDYQVIYKECKTENLNTVHLFHLAIDWKER